MIPTSFFDAQAASAIMLLSGISIITPYKWLPYLFILSAFFDKFMLNYSGINIRPSYIFGGVFFIKWILSGKARPRELRANPLFFPVLSLFLANIVGSYLNAPDRSKSLRLALLNGIFLAPFLALTSVLGDQQKFKKILRWYLWLGLVSAIVGVGAYILFVFGGVETILISTELGGRIVGTQHSAGDHFGIQMCTLAILAISFLSADRGKSPLGRWPYFKTSVFLLAAALSFKRSAWVGVIVGIAVIDILSSSWITAAKHAFFIFCAGVALVMTINFSPSSYIAPGTLMDKAVARYDELLDFGEGTGAQRKAGWDEALREWPAHPLVGSGTGSIENYESWISNDFIRALYDAGLLGFLSVLWIWTTLFMRGITSVTSSKAKAVPRHIIVAMIASISALFVINMVDDEFLLNLFWIQISLAISAFASSRIEPNVSSIHYVDSMQHVG